MEKKYKSKFNGQEIDDGIEYGVRVTQQTFSSAQKQQARGNIAAQETLVVGTNLDNTPTANSTNPVTSGGVYNAVANKEDVNNKVTSISSSSTNTQYAGAKAVYDLIKTPPLPIAFESPITKEIVARKFGGETGGLTGIAGIEGEVTFEQAAKDIGWMTWANLFKDVNANAPFTELKFFSPTGASRFQEGAFYNSKFTKLVFPEGFMYLYDKAADTQVQGAYIELPSTILTIGGYNFSAGYDYILKIHATTPPTINTLTGNGGLAHIYVPSASVDAYKAANNWSTFASIIEEF